jgi:hypothetical protein
MVALSMVAMVIASMSCSRRLIFDGEGDCGVYYNIRFKYDYNIKYANAFENEVNSVALYIFDESNVLIDTIVTTDKEALSSETFEIPLELEPGRYTLLAWCGLMSEESFDLLSDATIGATTLQEMQVRMHRTEGVQDSDLLPLFHGMRALDVSDKPGTYTETISLVKDTNVIRILLHELSGHEMSSDQFSFEITDQNGLYNYDNTRLEDEVITYKPWHQESLYADSETSRATAINAVMAELTIGRMSAESSPILTVTNTETGEEVLRIPVADYALLVKGNYRKDMGDQEYLDRQDEYSLTLFLDEGEWVSAQIIINGWRVVNNDTGVN